MHKQYYLLLLFIRSLARTPFLLSARVFVVPTHALMSMLYVCMLLVKLSADKDYVARHFPFVHKQIAASDTLWPLIVRIVKLWISIFFFTWSLWLISKKHPWPHFTPWNTQVFFLTANFLLFTKHHLLLL